MVRWTLSDTLAFLLLLSLLLPSLLIMFIPSTFKRPVSSWKALNLRKTLLMASSVRLKPLNCSRLPCVYAQETLTFLLTDKPTISMSLSHCIHQTLNSKASTRFHSGGLQQSLTLILNTFLFGVIILIANILKRAFSSQLAAKLRNRLLVL